MRISYKEHKEYIGGSDIAALTIRSGAEVHSLDFGGDGEYFAYVIDDSIAIPAHYAPVLSLEKWARIYDDDGVTASFVADKINVYRAGDYGCLIQLIGAQ